MASEPTDLGHIIAQYKNVPASEERTREMRSVVFDFMPNCIGPMGKSLGAKPPHFEQPLQNLNPKNHFQQHPKTVRMVRPTCTFAVDGALITEEDEETRIIEENTTPECDSPVFNTATPTKEKESKASKKKKPIDIEPDPADYVTLLEEVPNIRSARRVFEIKDDDEEDDGPSDDDNYRDMMDEEEECTHDSSCFISPRESHITSPESSDNEEDGNKKKKRKPPQKGQPRKKTAKSVPLITRELPKQLDDAELKRALLLAIEYIQVPKDAQITLLTNADKNDLFNPQKMKLLCAWNSVISVVLSDLTFRTDNVLYQKLQMLIEKWKSDTPKSARRERILYIISKLHESSSCSLTIFDIKNSDGVECFISGQRLTASQKKDEFAIVQIVSQSLVTNQAFYISCNFINLILALHFAIQPLHWIYSALKDKDHKTIEDNVAVLSDRFCRSWLDTFATFQAYYNKD